MLIDEGSLYLELFHDYETYDLMTGNSASVLAAGEHWTLGMRNIVNADSILSMQSKFVFSIWQQ